MFIREASRRTGLSEDTLRYYERIGVLPAVPRRASGIRNYEEYHIQYVALIQHLKASGLSLEKIQQYMELAKNGEATVQLRKQMLVSAKHTLLRRIARLQQTVQTAEFQITHYETSLLVQTERLSAHREKQASLP